MPRSMMKVARLHGLRDLRVEEIAIPSPAPGELLVKIEACGVCATDGRKYEIGVNDGEYPFNPGHEWLGRVAAVGAEVTGWSVGDRLYGDVYGGYAEYAVIPAEAIPWSRGPLRLPDGLPVERAIFVEPLADCIHAVHNQAKLARGHKAVVIAAGVMGLKIVAEAARLGVEVLVVEPLAERQAMARTFGATEVIDPAGWTERVKQWSSSRGGVDAVILTIGQPDLVNGCISVCRPGGRVVLFAGFGNRPAGTVNFNDIHYREIVLVGSEWIGTPPNQRRDCYDLALERLQDRSLPFETLVTARCTLHTVEQALVARQSFHGLKTMLVPE